MISVPGFLLRRLYVKGSLRNTDFGFAFQLKNTLGAGFADTMFPLALDGRALPVERTWFRIEGEEARTAFCAVNAASPFTLKMNRVVTVEVDGERLPPGPHKVEMAFQVKGVGRLAFDFTDNVE